MLVVMEDQDFSSFYTYPFRYFMLLIQERARRLIISHKNETKGKCQAGLTCSLRCSTKLFTFVHAFLFFQLLVFGSQLALGQEWDGIIITQADYQALEAFKHELVDPKGYLKSWNDTGYGACSGNWLGIKCAQGQVIVIKLPLKGLSGRVTEKIGQFQALRKLSLHDNDIGGSIPTSLGFLPNLRGVQLYNNRFSGSIPASLGLCPVLQTLELSNNSLSGTIPVSLVNSTKLYRLNVSYNALTGTIPESITESSSLIFIDLQHNNLSGSIPDTWGGNGERLFLLQSLTLNHNSFSGNIPVSLSKLIELLEISLSHNHISGVIPDDIGRLTRLRTLDLSHNNLTGEIPMSFNDLPILSSFNVSYNFLSGPVPAHLAQKFNSSAFSGNLQLCGYNDASAPCPKTPSPVKRGSKLRIKDIILIVVGALIIILFLLCCILLCCLIKKRAAVKAEKGVKGVSATAEEVEAAGETGGKLVHFDGPITFSADDLLCATADILGKSTYGTVYKATLEDGNQVAVKRLREKITKGQKEFEREVNVLGKIRHPNLLALRAYYLGTKGEKLLVFDYMPKGSIATFLHARSPDTPIDWPTRMRIAKGMTRGLLYLHTNANIIHGNLTSSNVLLDENTNAKIADYGLSRLVTPAANANVIATAGALGYRAPELSKLKKANVKTDVYSLGVIVLELLTGKSPGEATDGVDLPTRVASIVKVEGTSEVFDLELMRDASIIGDELLNTLKLALHCVDPSPSARPEVQRILQQLEEIRPERSASSGDDRAAPTAPSASD